ncbi:MAG: DUF11 domain-containing protein [Ardenticatenaceae bacterium]|nr:DUF11 domain-containing protein [Ardenticatenaceae bacterium]
MGISPQKRRHVALGIGVSLLFAFVLTTVVVGGLFAAPSAANLDSSTKTVSRSQAFPGETLHYTVVISNSGDTAVPALVMTDTLPVGLTYQSGSLTYTLNSAAVTSFGESNGVISWSGVVSQLGSVNIYYSAVLAGDLTPGTEIINAVEITGTGSLMTRAASTTIITSTQIYFPVMFQPVPTPQLNSIPEPNSSNQWTVSWSDVEVSGVTYELQEYFNTSFASPTIINAGTSLSQFISHGASIDNYYCYRVRATVNGVFSGWSSIRCTFGNYADNFSNSASGWSIRRQDTDDTDNSTYYSDGKFVIKIGGRWDYAIAAPMVPAPSNSYRIDTSVKLSDGVDNLHTYGIVFGGDWNGQPCPNAIYSSCFNHYYRLQVIWFGSPTKLRVDLKRIDYHDSDNIGRGDTKIFGFKDITVGDPNGWNKWTIERLANGTINVYVNDKYVGGGVDPTYVNDRYFGAYAASNEYSGTAANFDYFVVTALP